jgi:hypothetical protein
VFCGNWLVRVAAGFESDGFRVRVFLFVFFLMF